QHLHRVQLRTIESRKGARMFESAAPVSLERLHIINKLNDLTNRIQRLLQHCRTIHVAQFGIGKNRTAIETLEKVRRTQKRNRKRDKGWEGYFWCASDKS